ncbi:ABC transporter ATP-binding protein/permease [Shewanella sp. SR44-3]|uniref:ABCB family ABC transporter ATP-binding protein/permease n=1 Tax=Shewanella sp. SR44-3 TaxID=2760936 RepID=UPI0015F9AB54|nr:ABC transporter ATP-binding protein/permease [Shewanella sp. SR44-3]MBB1268610.1 ABC transporter ATP-binding protein/permease [Shewanella sp. SR44-3]
MRPSSYFEQEPASLNWRVMERLMPYLLEYKLRVFLALACLVAAKLASVGLPFILKDIVDTLSLPQHTSSLGAGGSVLSNALVPVALVPMALVLAYGCLRFLNVIIGEIRDTLFGRVTERAIRRLGLSVFEHLHALDLDFHLNRRTGGLSRDIERGTSGISFLMRFMVFNIVPTLLEITLVIGIFFYQYGLEFAAITLVSVLLYIAYSVVATQWRTSYVRDAAQADSISNGRAIDSLLNYETVKYFNNESFEAHRYDEALAQWELAKRKNRLSLLVLNSGQALIIAVAMTLMMALAATEVANNKMTIGDFVLINAFMMQLFIPLNFLGFVYREIRGALANIEKMFELLALTPKIVNSSNAIEYSPQEAQIEFNNVQFDYDGRPIIQGISFVVPAGKKVAVVGDSGAGKSTLIKLLFRFYDVEQGRISIGGTDIRSLSLSALRQTIAIVPQDTVLFNDTLYDNIRYGRPDATDAEIKQAAQLAHLSEFIESLPLQWQTKVGERGLKLSGGEKQRVSIARAILKGASILVFDEATSSLDSHAERAILDALKAAAKGHTSLVVAHRLSTIVDADMILVLSQGKIVEQGTHEGLLNKQGLYARLWHLQNEV